MDRVGVRELRQNLSVYLRRVTENQEVLEVTDRGQPVALLTPLPMSDDPIHRLEAMGLISRRATAHPSTLPDPAPHRGGPTLTEIILADREA